MSFVNRMTNIKLVEFKEILEKENYEMYTHKELILKIEQLLEIPYQDTKEWERINNE